VACPSTAKFSDFASPFKAKKDFVPSEPIKLASNLPTSLQVKAPTLLQVAGPEELATPLAQGISAICVENG
jgi:hypothetical protein